METNDLLAIYKSNRFIFQDNNWFSLENMTYANTLGVNFCIVTAFNPNNVQMPTYINETNNEQLRNELVGLGFSFIDCKGGFKEHFEDSFCIFDISFEESLAIGVKYEQYAIFYFSNGIGGYYEVATKELIV